VSESDGANPCRRKHFSATWAILLATVLVGAAARFYKLGDIPPGLYHDEAFNGLDAARVLEGDWPIFFTANNGREPLFLYGIALALALLGRTPFAVRLAAAILGTMLVPATYLMARALFNERVGLWSAVLIATAPWPVNLSRIGLRAISMPLVTALAVWLWWTGRQRASRRQMLSRLALSGLLFGTSLYTYTAARFIAVVAVFYVLFQWWIGREHPHRYEWTVPSLVAALVMAPLLIYGVTHWDTFVERPAQVSILSPEINQGDLWGTLARNLPRALGLFTCRGDFIPRHNVPLRPLFDPLISVFFLLGVLLCLGKARRGATYALALIWTGVMLLPTIGAEDCPHFLRAVGVLPMAAVFPALGLEWVRERLRQHSPGWVGNLMVGVVLGITTLWGSYDYFIRHGSDPELAYAFEADQVQEAIEINRFLGTGWQGKGIAEPQGELIAGRHVYLGPRMWEDRLTVNLLVASPERISILGRDQPVGADQVLVLAWPHGDMSEVQQVLPRPAQIEVWPGPLERGDLDAEPRLLYVAFRGMQLGQASDPAMARFEQDIELLGWDTAPGNAGQTHLQLRWRATHPLGTDYTVFVHIVRDDQVIAQDDGFPGGGFWPTTWWRPRDEIVDMHLLSTPYDPARDRIMVGWYEWRSMQHLKVLDEAGQGPHERPGETGLELR